MSRTHRLVLLSCMIAGCISLSAAVDAENLFKQEHLKRARAILEKQVAANPKDVKALVQLASVRLEFKDNNGALKLAQQAVDLQPQNAEAHETLAEAYGQKTEDDVGMFEKLRMARAFKREAEQALALDPKNVHALYAMMVFYVQAPGMIGGSKSKAIEFSDRILAVDPVQGNFAKADIARGDKQYGQEEAALLQAVKADAKSYPALGRLASFYSADKTKNYDKAIEYAKKAIRLDPGRASGYEILTRIYASQERWADLDQVVQQAEKDVPDDLNYIYQAGRVLLDTGKDNSRAERYFRQYLTQEPEGGKPGLAYAHWRLGLILEKEGRKPEAVQEVQTAVEMKSDLKEAQKDLKRMK